MLQLLKKLILHKIGSRNSTEVFISKFICHHLQITSTYKSIFTTEALHGTTASSVKPISGVTLTRNALDSIKCPYLSTIILSTLGNCK